MVSKPCRAAMFLDGDDMALRAYRAGDHSSELVSIYYQRLATIPTAYDPLAVL